MKTRNTLLFEKGLLREVDEFALRRGRVLPGKWTFYLILGELRAVPGTLCADHDDLQRMVGYQIRKFNACRKCLKCESLCRAGAISIVGDSYYINPDKCVHCKMCVTPKYLDGGCMMDKYLRTK